ncbi:MerR family transcriptional regulator [Anaerobacterium chartisolvens]|uniref:MerR family transcriptional regulator n=1 Tax=Anaerobacterium chartisolvens TaxID=1297424 RepID=A0A369B5F3_9FIRM|nr:MerR family transcriptional regulator [Anaerobacterium chartisolvens]
MFKIGEFSKLTQVSIRMLRYYDETGLLKPAKTDKFTNYRLYSAEQIDVLNKIVFLRDLGFNVAEIAAAMKHWDDGFITDRLENKRLEIEGEIKAAQDKLFKIELAKRDIRQQRIATHYNVSIKSIPSCQVLSLRRIVCDYYAEGELWEEMSAFADKNGIPISNSTFTIYHDTDYRETDVDIEICAPVSRTEKDMCGFTYRTIPSLCRLWHVPWCTDLLKTFRAHTLPSQAGCKLTASIK